MLHPGLLVMFLGAWDVSCLACMLSKLEGTSYLQSTLLHREPCDDGQQSAVVLCKGLCSKMQKICLSELAKRSQQTLRSTCSLPDARSISNGRTEAIQPQRPPPIDV